MIQSLQVMLPYLNDTFVVGKEIQMQNQSSIADNSAMVEEYGVVATIDDVTPMGYDGMPRYKIVFENNKLIYLEGVPMSVRY